MERKERKTTWTGKESNESPREMKRLSYETSRSVCDRMFRRLTVRTRYIECEHVHSNISNMHPNMFLAVWPSNMSEGKRETEKSVDNGKEMRGRD